MSNVMKLMHKHGLDARISLLFKCNGDIILYKIEKDLCIDKIPKFFKKFDMVEFYVEHYELCNALLANNNSTDLFCIVFAVASTILYIMLTVLLGIEVTGDALFFPVVGGSIFGGIYGLAFMMSLFNVKCALKLFLMQNESKQIESILESNRK